MTAMAAARIAARREHFIVFSLGGCPSRESRAGSLSQRRILRRRLLRNVPRYRKPLDDFDRVIHDKADQRQQHDGREHHRRVELAIVLQEQIAEPLVGGDELGDHRRGRGQRSADLQSGEDVRQRLRQPYLEEHAQAAGAGGAREVHHVAVGALESRDARNHDRKERQQEYQQELGHEAETEPDNEQRRDRDLRNDLQEYDHRVDGLLHEARIGDRQRQRNAYDHGKRIAGQNFLGRDPRAGGDQLVAPPEFGPYFRRRRQQIFLDVGQAYRELPKEKQQHEDRQRTAAIAQPCEKSGA